MTKRRKRKVNLGFPATDHLRHAHEWFAEAGDALKKVRMAPEGDKCGARALDNITKAAKHFGKGFGHLLSVEDFAASDAIKTRLQRVRKEAAAIGDAVDRAKGAFFTRCVR
jgi:hypothetical protein